MAVGKIEITDAGRSGPRSRSAIPVLANAGAAATGADTPAVSAV